LSAPTQEALKHLACLGNCHAALEQCDSRCRFRCGNPSEPETMESLPRSGSKDHLMVVEFLRTTTLNALDQQPT
jgi:hypothetical protein